MADEQRDVIEILEHDHREVEQMFSELESLRGASTDEDKERRKTLTEQVTIELVRHSVAEEVLVYPRVEDKVSVLLMNSPGPPTTAPTRTGAPMASAARLISRAAS